MCGRFEIHSAIYIIARIFQIGSVEFDVRPNYNAAPGQDIAVVVSDGRKNRLIACCWGFVPSWSREMKTGYRMINARAETIATSRSFCPSFENRRCLVVADGFFEWKKRDKARTPMLVRLRSGRPMGLAGLYNNWTSPEGETICTTTIITTEANDLLAPVHSRMPAVVTENAWALWLDPAVRDRERLLSLLKPFDSRQLEYYAVASRVNSFQYNDPENIKPVAAAAEEKGPGTQRTAP